MNKMNFKASTKRYLAKLQALKAEYKYPELKKSNYKILTANGEEYSRIYHVHIRKCAGTSFAWVRIGSSNIDS